MDWSEEDTEIMMICNRVRQVICKQNPAAYDKLMNPEETSVQRLSAKVGRFEVYLSWQGGVTILTRKSAVSSRQVFSCKPLQARSRPDCRWNREIVREEVVPALDAEMVLDDLSLL